MILGGTESATRPCRTSHKPLLRRGALSASVGVLPTGDGSLDPTRLTSGVVTVERLTDADSARARVAQARATFGGCRGSYSDRRSGNQVMTGRITSVVDEPMGDGGFTITERRTFDPPLPDEFGELATRQSSLRTSVFSVGPFVVQSDGLDSAVVAELVARWEEAVSR